MQSTRAVLATAALCALTSSCHHHRGLEHAVNESQLESQRLRSEVARLDAEVRALKTKVDDQGVDPAEWLKTNFGNSSWCVVLHADSQRFINDCRQLSRAECEKTITTTTFFNPGCVERPKFAWCVTERNCFTSENDCRQTADYWDDVEPDDCKRFRFP